MANARAITTGTTNNTLSGILLQNALNKAPQAYVTINGQIIAIVFQSRSVLAAHRYVGDSLPELRVVAAQKTGVRSRRRQTY